MGATHESLNHAWTRQHTHTFTQSGVTRNAHTHTHTHTHVLSLVSGPMVRHRVWVIVSVWVRFRVGVWDTFRLLFRVRLEVIRLRIWVRLRVRVDVEVSVCFWGLQ